MTALVFTGDVEDKLQRLQWIPKLTTWRPLRFVVVIIPYRQQRRFLCAFSPGRVGGQHTATRPSWVSHEMYPCPLEEAENTWWRHQMETFSALLAICAGNSPVTDEFLAQIASDVELWCFLWCFLWINGWVNNREAGDLRHHRAYYDVTVM